MTRERSEVVGFVAGADSETQESPLRLIRSPASREVRAVTDAMRALDARMERISVCVCVWQARNVYACVSLVCSTVAGIQCRRPRLGCRRVFLLSVPRSGRAREVGNGRESWRIRLPGQAARASVPVLAVGEVSVVVCKVVAMTCGREAARAMLLERIVRACALCWTNFHTTSIGRERGESDRDGGGTVVTEDGVEEREPPTPEEWQAAIGRNVRHRAGSQWLCVCILLADWETASGAGSVSEVGEGIVVPCPANNAMVRIWMRGVCTSG